MSAVQSDGKPTPRNGIPSLSHRLAAVAGFVRPGSRVADIGTDHAYLPAWLTGQGICPEAVAADIRPGPLSRARETVERYGLSDRITLRLSDGLDALRPGEAEDIVIAGMGGELVCEILSRASWVRDEKLRLVLQPMTHAETVRQYLYQNGYSLVGERAVRDGEHLYCVLAAAYAGVGKAHGWPGEQVDGELDMRTALIGTLGDGRDDEARDYVRHVYEKVRQAADGMRLSKMRTAQAERMEEISSQLENIMRGWTDKS